MPLYTKRSQAKVTFHGTSVTPITAADSRNSDLRRFRILPSYPSPQQRRELTSNASSSSFRTSYVLNDSSGSDSDESSISNISRQFWQKRALARGNFRVDDGESTDSDSMKSEPVSTQTYSTIHVTPTCSRLRKDVFRFNMEGTGMVMSLCKARTGHCWITRHNDKIIYLYHRTGHKETWRTISTGLEMMVIREDRVTFVVPELSKTIFKMAPTGRLSRFISFELEIGGICCTSRCETLVTTTPIMKSHKKGPKPRSVPSVLRLNQEGEVIWSIKHKGTEAFVKPSKIAVNVNGDICVLDLEPSRPHLVILSPDGEERRRYFGVQDKVLSHPFEPKDICCDRSGYIYLLDLHNSAVHVLDKQGNFKYFLFTKDDGYRYPSAITYESDGFVWVGFSCGAIRIFDTKQQLRLQSVNDFAKIV